MKAARFNDYGDYNQVVLEEVEKPIVKEDHVVVKVHAASINMLDIRVVTANPPMLKGIIGTPPVLNKLGSDLSGVVVEVGENVTEFSIGDEVFGQLAINQDGSFSEYTLVHKKQLALKPKGVSHSIVSTVPMAGVTALQGLRLVDVKEGSNVLVYGASGGVGTFVIQVAKALGAHVTAVCSTRNIDNAKASCADIIIDYKTEEWFDPSKQYDAVYVVNGKNPLQKYLDSTKVNGKIVLNVKTDSLDEEVKAFNELEDKQGKTISTIQAKISSEDYKILANWLDTDKLNPIIDKEFPLDQIQDAYKHFMSGKTLGKTVITIK